MCPRKRAGIGSVSCGYCTVTVGLKNWPIVILMPVTRLLNPLTISLKSVLHTLAKIFIIALVRISVNSDTGMRIFHDKFSRP